MTTTMRNTIPALPRRQLCLFMALMFILAAHVAWAEEPATTTSISLNDVKEAITDRLIAEGAGDNLEVVISGRQPTMLYNGSEEAHFDIQSIDFNARTMRWRTDIAFYEGDQLQTVSHIGGRYASLIPVPVLSRRLYSSDVIEAADIEWVDVEEHRLRKGTIMNEDELIGQSPRRLISDGRPVREDELIPPHVIDEGDLVQVFFSTTGMEIRTICEALDKGAVGDIIRVRNNQSKIVIQATITGPNSASVTSPAQLASAH